MNELRQIYRNKIERLAAASRRLGELGYVASHGGNLSERVDENVVLITPTKVAKREIVPDDICMIDMQGNVLLAAEGRKPTGETPMHLHIYEKRSDVRSAVHSHAPVLTGFAIAHSDLLERAVLPEPALELGPVLSIPYEEPLTQKLANAMDRVIERTNVFLMQNHGVTAMSDQDVSRTLDLTEMLENMAKSLVVAVQLGNVEFISEEEIENLNNVCKIRDLGLPGKRGAFDSLLQAFRTK